MFPSLFCNKAWPCVLVSGIWVEISHATCNTGHINHLHMIPSLALSSDWVYMPRASCVEDSRSSEPGSLYDSMEHSSVSPCLSLAGLCKGRQNSSFKPMGCQSFAVKVASLILANIITHFGLLQQYPDGENWGHGTQGRGGKRELSLMRLA